ncbi:DUF4198 domain-containing protein [Antarcticimicrobium luteum]|uniref:DUF4198 domain-containing protein n=1 Tax=Antarcticimicrobium luteum TaxID=2547397 RepID=A0A4R5UZW2_9RHOB|nr:DUF4198 domain-containing protein [Antarcticimicrobium luteum]TDK45008.1 DUF4198 domain-containing protein [Antarcticimicrobium luteum]
MYILPRFFPIFLAVLASLTAPAALAHEFWIAPTKYQVETGAPLVARLRNGQNFSGISYPYFDHQTARFELVQGGRVTPYAGRMGDLPALSATSDGDGLVVIVHQTMPSSVSYAEWEKFAAFAAHKDFPDIRARHIARGLPENGFSETYTRFAKALVGVGTAQGADAPTGMETEFVALANPYTDDLPQGFPVRLLYQGAPRALAQVEVFDRSPDGAVTITRLRTDDSGTANIPVAPGHEYLLDAVVLRPAPAGAAEVWETLWAAMTFSMP